MPDEDVDRGSDDGVEDNGFDKVRQQIQQELGNKMRPIEDKLAVLDELSEKISNLGAASGSGKEESTVLDDELDLLISKDQDDIDPYAASKSLAKRLKVMEKSLEDKLSKIEDRVGDVATSTRQSQTDSFKRDFQAENPNLDYEDTVRETQKRLEDLLGDGDVSDAVYQKLVDREFVSVVADMSSGLKSRKGPSKRPDKDPAGSIVERGSRGSGRGGKKTEGDYVSALVTDAD